MKSKSAFYLLFISLVLLSFALISESARANGDYKAQGQGKKPPTIKAGGEGKAKFASNASGAGNAFKVGGRNGGGSGAMKMIKAKAASNGGASSAMSEDFFNAIGKEPSEEKSEWSSAIAN